MAIRQFEAERDGKTVVVLEGARLPAGDAVVKAHPSMFAPAKRSSGKRAAKR